MSNRILIFISSLTVLAIVLAACGLGGSGAAATPAAPLVGDATAGQSLFAQKCATCHGPAGAGAIGRGRILNPASDTLRGTDAAAFNANIIEVVTHGRRRMPAWGDTGRLNSQQIADLAAYIMSLNP